MKKLCMACKHFGVKPWEPATCAKGQVVAGVSDQMDFWDKTGEPGWQVQAKKACALFESI